MVTEEDRSSLYRLYEPHLNFPTREEEFVTRNTICHNDRRSGLCPVPLSRRGLALLSLRGWPCSVDLLVPDQQDVRSLGFSDSLEAYPRILFELGVQCLRLALRAILVQATAPLRARLYRTRRWIDRLLS